jgi:hypothetical protein
MLLLSARLFALYENRQMLISLDYKFIFIANLKTASSSVENALRRFSEIALVESRFEKHAPLSEIERRFSWAFDIVQRSELFKFSVIRDPVDYVLSIYNSHADQKFASDPALYTRGINFSEFRTRWAETNADQLLPQCNRFLSGDGTLGVDYIVSYDNLADGFRFVTKKLGISAQLERVNASERYVNRPDLSSADIEWVNSQFQQDTYILSYFCDRVLTSEDRFAATTKLNPPSRQVHRLDPPNNYQLSGGWDELIHALYRVLLLRDPDSSGMQSRLTSLREGLDLEGLLKGFVDSDEFSRIHRSFINEYVRPKFLSSVTDDEAAAENAATITPAGRALKTRRPSQ